MGRRPSPAEAEPLPTNAWALLGLLSFGRELTGYELRKWADLTVAHFYRSLTPAGIYADLRRLEAAGHVAVDPLTGDLGTRRRYRLTPAGEDALRAWLTRAAHASLAPASLAAAAPPFEPEQLSPEFHLWLGHLHDPARLRELLRAARALADKRATEAESDALSIADSPGLSHAALSVQLAARAFADQRDRLDAALAELD